MSICGGQLLPQVHNNNDDDDDDDEVFMQSLYVYPQEASL